MYLKEKAVKILKIKNAIFAVIGVLQILISLANLVSLVSYYWDDLEKAITAKSTNGSVIAFFIGVLLVIFAIISKNMICDAYFYSSYFEGDLDGLIAYGDLSSITGKSILYVKIQLHIFRLIYMKNYDFGVEDEKERIELLSKKYSCECRTCGATIKKSVYFTGRCDYCGSSDLFAKVITGNRLYSISNKVSDEAKTSDFYASKRLINRKAGYAAAFCLGVAVFLIAFIACTQNISFYNDKEHLTEILMSGESYSSYALIKADIMNDIIYFVLFMILPLPFIWATYLRLRYIFAAEQCAKYFAKRKTPYVKMSSLPPVKKKKHGIKLVKGAICHHYLLNCNFEKRGSGTAVVLARKIVKDECPSCGASIVGAVDENYRCRYCGSVIMNVVLKK